MKTIHATKGLLMGLLTGMLLLPVAALASNSDHHHDAKKSRHNHANKHQQPQAAQAPAQWQLGEQVNSPNLPTVSVPEPTSVLLLGTGLLGLFFSRKMKKTKTNDAIAS